MCLKVCFHSRQVLNNRPIYAYFLDRSLGQLEPHFLQVRILLNPAVVAHARGGLEPKAYNPNQNPARGSTITAHSPGRHRADLEARHFQTGDLNLAPNLSGRSEDNSDWANRETSRIGAYQWATGH